MINFDKQMENVVVVGIGLPDVIRVIEAINSEEKKINFLGFLDDKDEVQGKEYWGYPVLGKLDWLDDYKHQCKLVSTVARTTAIRKQVYERLKKWDVTYTSLIHPDIDMSHNKCGDGIIIYEGSIVGPNATIDDQVIISGNTFIAHDVKVGAFSFVAAGAAILGHVQVGEGVMIGANSACYPKTKIGEWSTVGLCSAVFTDVPEHAMAVGNPARMTQSLRGATP